MDNDPSQNSYAARTALQQVECELLPIPARSPDLNPIENVFHNVKSFLQQEAIESQITSESFEEFKERVLRTLDNVEIAMIDRTIESMPKRILSVISCKGYRTKY